MVTAWSRPRDSLSLQSAGKQQKRITLLFMGRQGALGSFNNLIVFGAGWVALRLLEAPRLCFHTCLQRGCLKAPGAPVKPTKSSVLWLSAAEMHQPTNSVWTHLKTDWLVDTILSLRFLNISWITILFQEANCFQRLLMIVILSCLYYILVCLESWDSIWHREIQIYSQIKWDTIYRVIFLN